jgi:hypothetical protein
MSLGELGVVFAGYAYPVPEDYFEKNPDSKKFFDVVDEDDVTEEEQKAATHNMNRNLRFRHEAIKNAKMRRRVQEKALAAAALSEQMTAMMTDDFPDSDDD